MTDLRNHELAVGKLLASLLNVGVLLATSLPVYCILKLLGGVTWSQIAWSQAIVASAALAAGSWGCLVAFWRDKTFQTLAISVLGVVLFILLAHGGQLLHPAVPLLSPYFGLLQVVNPLPAESVGVVTVSALPTVLLLTGLAVALSTWTILRLRVWNPSRELRQSVVAAVDPESTQESAATTPVRQHRHVWNQPVIWREMRTRAYGRRMIWIKLSYIVLALAVAAYSLLAAGEPNRLVLGMVSPPAFAFLGIGILSLLLTNAQAVTSLTNERDGGTLDILLVTNIRPREFIAGKIGGALWNAREMILLPLLLLVVTSAMGHVKSLTVENLVYVAVTWLVLSVFAVTLG
jgi:hypothetical protein